MRVGILFFIFISFQFWALAGNEDNDCRGKNIIQFSDYLKRKQETLLPSSPQQNILEIRNDYGAFFGKAHHEGLHFKTTHISTKQFSPQSFIVNAVSSEEDSAIGELSSFAIHNNFQKFISDKTSMNANLFPLFYKNAAEALLQLRSQYSDPDATLSAISTLINRHKIIFAHIGNARAFVFKSDPIKIPKKYSLSFSTPPVKDAQGELVSRFHNGQYQKNKDVKIQLSDWITLDTDDHVVITTDLDELDIKEINSVLDTNDSAPMLTKKLTEVAQKKKKGRSFSISVYQHIY